MKHVLIGCLVLVLGTADVADANGLFGGRLHRTPASRPMIGGHGADVNHSEVMRLGDTVQHVEGNSRQATSQDTYVSAMGPPASDADKWFISVITTRDCQACERLKRDWTTNPWLQALANPNDSKQSWAHFNVYSQEDRSQAWRWNQIKVRSYPTILVQPPRDGRYGDSSTVVFQDVYRGDPQRLASNITQAIKLYVNKLQQQGLIHSPQNAHHDTSIVIRPPWQPVPQRDPYDQNDRELFPNLKIPPAPVERDVQFPWTAIMTLLTAGFSIPAIIALVIWVVATLRDKRKADGKEPFVSDELFETILEHLRDLSESKPEKKKPTRRKKATK